MVPSLFLSFRVPGSGEKEEEVGCPPLPFPLIDVSFSLFLSLKVYTGNQVSDLSPARVESNDDVDDDDERVCVDV